MKKSANTETDNGVYDISVGVSSLGLQFSHRRTPFSTNAPHAEERLCEMTVYVESGKSMNVENTIYVTGGTSVFTFRPSEVHFGIHKPNNMHERYVILIDPMRFEILPGAKALLGIFFDRNAGERNMISLSGDDERQLIMHLRAIFAAGQMSCDKRLYRSEEDCLAAEAVMTAEFLLMLSLLRRCFYEEQEKGGETRQEILRTILSDMEQRFSTSVSLSEYAAAGGISLSTMERLFRASLQMTPGQYLMARRIECAKEALRHGADVTEACFTAGFRDYSHFIADFRRHTGYTPAKYRRMMRGDLL